MITELLEWSGDQMDAYYASIDLLGEGHVSWASEGPVPVWFDIAQDLTERWVHQMQTREAVDRVEGYSQRYLPVVLRTFVWALPHQYRVDAPAGTAVQVDLASGGVWLLVSEGAGRWSLGATNLDHHLPIAEEWAPRIRRSRGAEGWTSPAWAVPTGFGRTHHQIRCGVGCAIGVSGSSEAVHPKNHPGL